MNLLELSEQELNRRQSLEELRKMGINPYPAAEYPVNAYSEEIRNNFDDNASPRTVCWARPVLQNCRTQRGAYKSTLRAMIYAPRTIKSYTTSFSRNFWIWATLSALRATCFVRRRARSASTPKSLRSSPRAFGRYRL